MRRKCVFSKWTLVLTVVLLCQYVYSRPQDASTTSVSDSAHVDKPTENPLRSSSPELQEATSVKEDSSKPADISTVPSVTSETSRDVKNKGPVIRDSIKMVANQLLEKPSNASLDAPIVPDTRIPPKLKNQLSHKHKIKTRNEDGDVPMDNAHAGVAVPMSMEELESENKVSESSTTNEGISTWILLSNPSSKENDTVSTEPTKIDDSQKKQKPVVFKNKTKRPQSTKVNSGKRPVIGSTNKSDLVASGSAINENVFNKIKDTVLSNVQKNKSTPTQRTTTVITTTTSTTTTEVPTTRRETATKAPAAIIPVVKVTSKPSKKKNKNKPKTSTTPAPIQESALLPMEPKEQEIELEVNMPVTTTKKPKRTSTKKKNKTKKRKTSKPKPEAETAVSEIKTTANKTKSVKPAKKPSSQSGPITTQIYNYFSREVMPSVGVGVIGLASLVGLASYFLYPFSTPVRRTFEVDKRDDLYKNNAEEYANEGNGQAEEEMLGTVLAGMPAHSKQKLNPYAGQTHVSVSRYPVKKEQDIRYRHVATTSYEPNYNVHYPQQKTGIAHGAVYSKPINYGPQQYDTRNVYTTESKYVYDKAPNAYTPYPAVEPIYAAPQTGPSAVSSYGNDASNSVVYGVKPSADSDFRPVYPFEGKIYSETTSNPMTYPPTSMYLGSNNEEQQEDTQYEENANTSPDAVDNKFVVGNVPKELVESATPAVVPEHGPRNLRKRRHAVFRKRAITGSIEEMLKEANKDIFISNEIDENPGLLIRNLAPATEAAPIKNEVTTTPEAKDVYTVYAMSVDPTKDEKSVTEGTPTQDVLIENVSTLPINNDKTETEMSNDLEVTTKAFRVYEVFTNNPTESEKLQTGKDESGKIDTTTQFKNMMTETTTEFKSETTSTMPPSPSPISETKLPSSPPKRPRPTMHPEVITYPPLNQEGGFFSFLKRLVEFKYRLGLSILQTTSDNLNRYLRSMEDTVQKVAKASH
ncbi:uncharacterized protein LOC114349939 [Ostrinia furnacalis]|uniref:uncharacterized protein LOC114349939 n=1 Tax=Ostrinia furnacalis TaxID=93504 RepID=UPI00103F9E39|nr:uncharacterized protein LOC114349939 [Ostrinia furnacalis]XP_028156338.1 uncharacterized protein LOC114349939 [Ostrinia furnacalis]